MWLPFWVLRSTAWEWVWNSRLFLHIIRNVFYELKNLNFLGDSAGLDILKFKK
jgi:hypothetical protein